MGHTNDGTFQSYISSLVGIDTQSVIHGREQRVELISFNSSMMRTRNLLAPMPPGSRLTEMPPQKEVHILGATPAQQYAKRRQARREAFREERVHFFEDGPSTADKSLVESEVTSRQPSRYLRALFKFEQSRYKFATLLYPDIGDDFASEKDQQLLIPDDGQVSLREIVEPLTEIANPQRSRYKYRGSESLGNGYCSFCKKEIDA
jgi:hypothetical protein